MTSEQNSYPVQNGTWTLTAPDGRQFQADTPLRCASLEQRNRIPTAVRDQRIFDAADAWCEGAIWLRTDHLGPNAEITVLIERDGQWMPIIHEPAGGRISHIVETRDIDEAIRKTRL